MNTSNTLKAYGEIHYILSIMPKSFNEKVPSELRNIFKEKRDHSYIVNIDKEKSLKEQNLLKETKAILAMLKYNYWCESKEEKDLLIKKFKENENKYQQYIREKYNPDNIFKKAEEKIEMNNEITEIVEYKEKSAFKIILEKIKNLFKIK